MVIGRGALALAALAALAAAWGCHEHEHDHEHGQDNGNEAGHGHGHGEGVAIGVTEWTEKLELFAEHPPAVVGEALPLVAHLTVLEGFTPLEEAKVTLVLEGPGEVTGSVEEMLRSGIFQPRVTPTKPGRYEARLEVQGPVVTDTIRGFSIEVYPDRATASEAHPAGAESEVGAITFLKEQQWKVPFATTLAERRTLVPTIEVAGEVTTPPGGRAEVAAPIGGRLVAPPGGLPRPGQEVRAGERLASIAPSPSSPEGEARAHLAVAEAEARLAGARSAVERSERLIQANAIPERELEEARREEKVAREALAAARRAQRLYEGASSGRGAGTWRLTAPIGGRVVSVSASPGESVSAGQVLSRIVDSSELWLRARVPEQQAARLRTDEDASYRIAGLREWQVLDVTGEEAAASVVSVDPTVDPESRTVGVLYALEDPDPRLRVGGMVRLGLPIGEPVEQIAVPRGAVIERDGGQAVYVQTGGETFEERTVRVGARAGGWIAIERGVEEGERVVIRGGNLVRLASRVSAGAGHGHVH